MTVLALVLSLNSKAQTSIGTYHSAKGFGLGLEIDNSANYCSSFYVIADMMDVWSDMRSSVGAKCTYTHNIIFKRGVLDRDVSFDIYAGPGLTGGYARDSGKDYGFIAGISGTGGIRLKFVNKLNISLDFNLDLCCFTVENERYGNMDMSFYKAGVTHFPYPQIRISYTLR